MKRTLLISVFTAAVLTMTGCGSSSEDSSNDNSKVSIDTTPTEITTVTEAQHALSAASVSPFSSSAQQSPARSASFRATIAKAPETSACQFGGEMTSNYDDPNNMLMSYTNCGISPDMSINGTMSITDNGTKQTGTLTYTYGGEVITMTMNADDIMQYMTLTGTFGDTFGAIALNAFKEGVTLGVETANEICSYDANGIETCTQNISGPYDSTVDGTISLELTNEFSCLSGSYTYKTLETLHHLTNDGSIESGKLDINGVKYQYNSEGTIDVTFKDGRTETIQPATQVTCN